MFMPTARVCERDRIDGADLNVRSVQPLADPAMVEDTADSSQLADVARRLIVAVLGVSRGNATLAAREPGVSHDTLRYRMEKYAVERDHYLRGSVFERRVHRA
jgi:DNA-binding NtrC family response regulator